MSQRWTGYNETGSARYATSAAIECLLTPPGLDTGRLGSNFAPFLHEAYPLMQEVGGIAPSDR